MVGTLEIERGVLVGVHGEAQLLGRPRLVEGGRQVARGNVDDGVEEDLVFVAAYVPCGRRHAKQETRDSNKTSRVLFYFHSRRTQGTEEDDKHTNGRGSLFTTTTPYEQALLQLRARARARVFGILFHLEVVENLLRRGETQTQFLYEKRNLQRTAAAHKYCIKLETSFTIREHSQLMSVGHFDF